MKRLIARSGERTKILHIVSDSLPQTARFTARCLAGDGPPRGVVEVVRRRWFARKPPEIHALAARQSFPKGFADVDYAIYVTPEGDTEIVFESRHFERHVLYRLLAGLVVLAILSAVLVRLL